MRLDPWSSLHRAIDICRRSLLEWCRLAREASGFKRRRALKGRDVTRRASWWGQKLRKPDSASAQSAASACPHPGTGKLVVVSLPGRRCPRCGCELANELWGLTRSQAWTACRRSIPSSLCPCAPARMVWTRGPIRAPLGSARPTLNRTNFRANRSTGESEHYLAYAVGGSTPGRGGFTGQGESYVKARGTFGRPLWRV